MSYPDLAVISGYYAILGILCVLSTHRLVLLALLWTDPPVLSPAEPAPPATLPTVLIQLPVYNEPFVISRLIDAVCQIEYPPDKLTIQVLDDSTDETTERVADCVARIRAGGLRIEHVRRADRVGYKGGALAEGLRASDAELVAIFDADFLPPPDFLLRTVGHFGDPEVGMVQARWEYTNRDASLLTRVQALFLDAHFLIEHRVRSRRGLFFNFNGTAGIWRRSAIDDAGGWQHETLTEDLDLSYRAQLRGWKFLYRQDLAIPSDLPDHVRAYRSQQQRWSKGSIETARKLLSRIWKSSVPLFTKADATFHLLANLAYVLLPLLVILSFPLFLARERHGLWSLTAADLFALLPATLVILLYLATAARLSGQGVFSSAKWAVIAMAVGIGMSLNNGYAALEGLAGRRTPFIRTAKPGNEPQTAARTGALRRLITESRAQSWVLPLFELFLAGYILTLIATASLYRAYWALPFALLFAVGYLLVALLDLRHKLRGLLCLGRAVPPDRLTAGSINAAD